MIATIARLFVSAFSAVKANRLLCLLVAVLALALLAAIWRADRLSGALALEKSEHARTAERGEGWKAAYGEALADAAVKGEAIQACLAREVAAREALQERTALLQAARPRARTATERLEVVDDETRQRAAVRLNRPW